MPTETQKLKLKKPAGTENVTRAAYNENLDLIDAGTQKNITQGTVAPEVPAAGDLWLDTSTTPHKLKRYDGNTWIFVGVELNDTLTSTSTTQAATANAVKKTNDQIVSLSGDLSTHISDTVKHVTQTDKDNWNGKANVSEVVKLGTVNTDVNRIKALPLMTDTRSATLTYTSGNLTKVEDKDGATVVKTTDLTYDANGNLTQVKETVGATVVTTTLSYDGSGNLTGTSKAVT